MARKKDKSIGELLDEALKAVDSDQIVVELLYGKGKAKLRKVRRR